MAKREIVGIQIGGVGFLGHWKLWLNLSLSFLVL